MARTVGDYESIWTEVRDPESGRYRSGHGVILRGAAIPLETVEAAVMDSLGDGWGRLVVEVQHLAFHPRIKHCSNLDGFGCDLEGDWHSHWSGVKHNDASSNCCYTVALPVWSSPSVREAV